MNKLLTDFFSNNFKTATLLGRHIDEKLKISLIIKYNNGAEAVLNVNNLKLCNDLLTFYLSSAEVIGVKYDTYVFGCMDNYNITINKLNNSLNLSFDGNIKEVFPDLIKRLEQAKRDGILNYFRKNISTIDTLCITNITVDSNSYINFSETIRYDKKFNFVLLQVLQNGKKIIYEPDIELVKQIIKEFLKSDSQIDYDLELNKLLNLDPAVFDLENNNKIKVGNRYFIKHDLAIIDLIKECLIELKNIKRSKL